MNRKIGIILFVFFCYLIWLYFATYESSTNNWWTVKDIKHTTEDTVHVGISMAKVLIGSVIFSLSGFLFYLLIRKRD